MLICLPDIDQNQLNVLPPKPVDETSAGSNFMRSTFVQLTGIVFSAALSGQDSSRHATLRPLDKLESYNRGKKVYQVGTCLLAQ